MRWGSAVISLGLAACLDAPPSSTVGEGQPDASDGDGDGDAAAADGLALGGMAASDPLSLDGRDELVLVGQRDGKPVAVVLSAMGPAFADVTAVPVALPFDPIDLVVSRWGTLTGLAVMLGPDASLAAIDRDAAVIDFEVLVDGEQADLSFSQLSDIQNGGRRLLLADDDQLYVTNPMGTGVPGEQPLVLESLGTGIDARIMAGGFTGTSSGIGIVEQDDEIDVYPFSANPDPTLEADRVVGDQVPATLVRERWGMFGNNSMLLIGIDRDVGGLWYYSASLLEILIETGTELDGQFDALVDLVITRLDAAVAELVVLAESEGQLMVVVYVDPAATPDELPTPLMLPISGLSAPYWMQAMDAVLDEGATGQNEIIVYDQAGHVACVDLAPDSLVSCGTLDLAADLSGSGASTSGRPGW